MLDDADVEAVADGVFTNAFANCGQICVAIKRVYAPASVYGRLVDALADRVCDDVTLVLSASCVATLEALCVTKMVFDKKHPLLPQVKRVYLEIERQKKAQRNLC